MVTVTAVTQSPPTLYALLSSCEQPNTGGPLTYGCLATDYFPEITSLSWSKDKEPITTGLKTYQSVFNKKGTYTLSSQLTITESEVGSGTIYCRVQRSGSEWKIQMPDHVVQHPTVILTASSSEKITTSSSATAVCSIIDFRPKSVTVNWLKNGQLMDSGFVTSPVYKVNGNFSATSRLTVPAGEWFAGSAYTCRVSHQGFTQSQNISGSSGENQCNNAKITLPQPSLEQVLLEATVTLTCVVSFLKQDICRSRGPRRVQLRYTTDSSDHILTEDYEEESGNIWTTASTFIILFFLSISYSAAVTLVKVK